jgi:hypothetical protein
MEDRVAVQVAGLEQEVVVVVGVMVKQVLQMDVTVLKEMEEAVVQQISFLQKLTQEDIFLTDYLSCTGSFQKVIRHLNTMIKSEMEK